ncbi:cation:proton antiporter [Sulfuracidifex metallicus]|uniref:Cation:proton antiporter n=1 Tax=Sulfuracidifex metallicus DSM 6482 = JCM 9184 TaxID=523847 RepID=A0A6A9QRM5_SULME|nr:cation:proton antiporter [Sulfuracidifex metallicus]MUN28463.1 cation:proton antiporter [Sulfuracidifex metallicus DSM 6482 = JCM 9184]WOE51021.1 cation:proton antiporter [Sulfuracidifex metallicus DSM 6482 = JCM 9184]
MNYEYLSIVLLFTLTLAYILSKVKLNPIVAYLIGGVIGTSFLGINFNSSYFSILTFLALNLLSFEIGAGFNISKIGPLLRKSITIALVELSFITTISYLAGIYILHFSPLGSTFLVLASLDTSTSILYKLFERKNVEDRDVLIAVASIEDVEVFFLYSFFVALNGSFRILTVVSVIIELLVASALIYVIAKFFVNRVINGIIRIEDQGITTLIPVTLVFVFQFISTSVGVPTTLSMILAGIAFASVSSSDKVFKLSSPIRDLSLIFFFLSVGGYLKLSLSILEYVIIGILVLGIKYFSFSTASWITGSPFKRAFTDGFYMIAISEFGIIVSIDAINSGINIFAIYYLSVVVVLLSSILVSFVDIKIDYLEEMVSYVYSKSFTIRTMDSAFLWLNRNVMKGISPIARSSLFKAFIITVGYIILPLFLFSKLNLLIYTFVSPLVGISFITITESITDIFVGLIIFVGFSIQVSKIYYTLYTIIVINLMKVRAKWLKNFWKVVLSPIYVGQRFYLLTSGSIFWIFDLSSSILSNGYLINLLPILLVVALISIIYLSIFYVPYKIDSSIIGKPPSNKKLLKITVSSIKRSKKRIFNKDLNSQFGKKLEEVISRV